VRLIIAMVPGLRSLAFDRFRGSVWHGRRICERRAAEMGRHAKLRFGPSLAMPTGRGSADAAPHPMVEGNAWHHMLQPAPMAAKPFEVAPSAIGRNAA
jgi:hypothetical protein